MHRDPRFTATDQDREIMQEVGKRVREPIGPERRVIKEMMLKAAQIRHRPMRISCGQKVLAWPLFEMGQDEQDAVRIFHHSVLELKKSVHTPRSEETSSIDHPGLLSGDEVGSSSNGLEMHIPQVPGDDDEKTT